MCGFVPLFATVSILLLITGVIWGLAFAPADYQQGNSFRIIYIHVPAAIFSMGIYVFMAIAGVIGLVWQIRQAYLEYSRYGTHRYCVYFFDIGHWSNLG